MMMDLGFNSKLVRLEVRGGEERPLNVVSFNSKLVRLEAKR